MALTAICGVYSRTDKRDALRRKVQSMVEALPYEGASRDKFIEMGPLLIGLRQFSIDRSDDVYPITNEDGSVLMVCNGEIYGAETVRQELETKGHRFRSSNSDEVIVHLYEEYGLDFFSHIDGMFALVLWDKTRNRLIIARDRFGIKPIFYTLPTMDGSFSFSSQLLTLVGLDDVSRELDSTAVHQFFSFSYILNPRTVYKSIRRVSPGNFVNVENAVFDVRSYWELPTGLEPLSMEEGAVALDSAISNAVAKRLPKTGTPCTYLSGGNDSSAVAYHMAQHSRRPVHTFTARFNCTDGTDEGDMAAITAKHLGTKHHEVWMTPEDVKRLPGLMANFGEPFADPSATATYMVAQRIRESAPISLCGDGADEILGGYELYAAAQMAAFARFIPDRLRRMTLGALNRMPITVTAGGLDLKLRNARRFFAGCQLPAFEQHEVWKVYLTEQQKAEFYTPEFLSTIDPSGSFPLLNQWRPLFAQAGRDWLTPVQYVDIKTYLVDNNMTKVETAGMANGLEIRMPYLDLNVFTTSFRLPTTARTHWGKKKILSKKLMKGRLPDEILYGQKKGFGVPFGPWFRNEMAGFVGDALRPERIARTGVIRPEVGPQLVATHKAGRLNVYRKMWNIICFLAWFENHSKVPAC